MATKGKFRFSQPGGSHPFVWLLCLLGLGLLAWVFCEHPQAQVLQAATKTPTNYQTLKPPIVQTPKLEVQPAASIPQPATRTNQQLLLLTPTTRMPVVSKPSTNIAPDPQNPALRERVLRAQLALIRQGISPGSLDGLLGPQTRAALRAFQQKQKLAETGGLDASTLEYLVGSTNESGAVGAVLVNDPSKPQPELYTNYIVSDADLAATQPLGQTWLAKSKQSRLDYENILEALSEKSQSHPNLIRWLNPAVNWESVAPGTTIKLPNIELPMASARAAYVKIRLSTRTMEAFDEQDNMLAHFPCSIGQRMEQRPVGELHVLVIVLRPNYTFDPDVFPESPEGRELGRKLILPPGPNNPVGSCWIGLDKAGYGIHGTPRPEQVGRTESHGCFRLANWNAEFLARLAWVGLPVLVD